MPWQSKSIQTDISSYNIGNAIIYQISENNKNYVLPKELFLSYDKSELEKHLNLISPYFYDTSTESLILSVHSYLVIIDNETILIDTCIGNYKNRNFYTKGNQLNTSYIEKLSDIIHPSKINKVICTHLHLDHVGWNTIYDNQRWLPTFKNAIYLFSKVDYNYWKKMRETKDPKDITDGCFEDSITPIIQSGQAIFIDSKYKVNNHMYIESLPGHSPGHFCIYLSSADDEVVFSGDTFHHPIQILKPQWSTVFCSDPELSSQSRQLFLNKNANTGRKIFPAHFPAPTVVEIIKKANCFEFQTV